MDIVTGVPEDLEDMCWISEDYADYFNSRYYLRMKTSQAEFTSEVFSQSLDINGFFN